MLVLATVAAPLAFALVIAGHTGIEALAVLLLAF